MSADGEYDVDWVISTASDVHIALNRRWFTSYTPFESVIQPIMGTGPVPVLGVGKVELSLKRPGRNPRPSSHTIVLHDVVHAPNAVCNMVSWHYFRTSSGCNADFGVGGAGEVRNEATGRAIGIIDTPKLPKLRLSGQAPNQSNIDMKGHLSCTMNWGAQERARWEEFKALHAAEPQVPTSQPEGNDASADTEPPYLGNPPYTTEEKRWLGQHFGNEFKFLMLYGLSIWKEDDREEGRAIARTMMQRDLQLLSN